MQTSPETCEMNCELDDGSKLTLYRKNVDDKFFLIYVPASMARDLIDWFHTNLMHPGESRLAETIR